MSSWLIFEGGTPAPDELLSAAEEVFTEYNQSIEEEPPTTEPLWSYGEAVGSVAYPPIQYDSERVRFTTAGYNPNLDWDEPGPDTVDEILRDAIEAGRLGALDWGVIIVTSNTTNMAAGWVYDGTELIDVCSGEEPKLGVDVSATIEYYHGASVHALTDKQYWVYKDQYRPELDLQAHEEPDRTLRAGERPPLRPLPEWAVVVIEDSTVSDPGDAFESLFTELELTPERVEPLHDGDNRVRFEFQDPVITTYVDPPAADLPVPEFLTEYVDDTYHSWLSETGTAVVVSSIDGEPSADLYDGPQLVAQPGTGKRPRDEYTRAVSDRVDELLGDTTEIDEETYAKALIDAVSEVEQYDPEREVDSFTALADAIEDESGLVIDPTPRSG